MQRIPVLLSIALLQLCQRQRLRFHRQARQAHCSCPPGGTIDVCSHHQRSVGGMSLNSL